MGLDMYLEGRTFNWNNWDNPEKDERRDGYRVRGVMLELGYWRKHPNLHGYIVATFAGGVDDCKEIPLLAEDLRKIIQAIKDKKLPHTSGFFFGESDASDDAPSIATFEKALAWLEGGYKWDVPAPEKLGEIGTMVRIEPATLKDSGGRESRDVIYRASW